MKTIAAIIKNPYKSLNEAVDVVNNGRTDDSYFCLNGNTLTISNPYKNLSEDQQIKSLKWFLSGIDHKICTGN